MGPIINVAKPFLGIFTKVRSCYHISITSNPADQKKLLEVKFMFSKKATKIEEIVTVNRQIDGEDVFNFCGLLRKHELYLLRNILNVNLQIVKTN
jgi:hypothetical protein